MRVALLAGRKMPVFATGWGRQGEHGADPSPLLQRPPETAWTQFASGAIHELSLPSGAAGLNSTPARARVNVHVPIGGEKWGCVRRIAWRDKWVGFHPDDGVWCVRIYGSKATSAEETT